MADFLTSFPDLYERGKRLLDSYREKKLSEKYDNAQQARLNPALIEFLEFFYPYALLKRAGFSYPVLALGCPESQHQNVESILGELLTTDRTDFTVNDPSYLKVLEKQGKRIYNGRTYVMDSLERTEEHKLYCSLGYYYDAMTTCDILEWEILTVFGSERISLGFDNIRRQLKYRNEHHRRVSDPAFDGRGRSAALSISTLIVFNDGVTYRALIRMRSGKTAAHSDLYHVVPSFIFQPVWSYLEEEYSVKHNIYREYLEEIFGVKEVENSSGEIAFDFFYKHDKLVQLRSLLESKGAELLLTGYAVNLLNLRPEICTLLLIRDESWSRQKIVANWEFLVPHQAYERRQDTVAVLNILRNDEEIALDLSNIPGTFVPPGAAAFWLGIDLARRLI